MNRSWIVQLPFPSTHNPNPVLEAYYRDYEQKCASRIPGFHVPKNGLWEMPLWVAHLAGQLESLGFRPALVDLSTIPFDPQACVSAILAEVPPDGTVLLSPLAQNFNLARYVSRALLTQGRRTVLGGNMASLAEIGDASLVYRGIADASRLGSLLLRGSTCGIIETHGDTRHYISWKPSYALLKELYHRPALLRLNASHGCLFTCSFCGDVWSRKLHVVPEESLSQEVAELEQAFPETHLIYLGDKTFGQSAEAVTNLMTVFRNRAHYRLIVQTHVRLVTPALIDVMRQLNVVVVELGFESADASMLRGAGKLSLDHGEYERVLDRLVAAGFKVNLNILGGLPMERCESHESTLEAISRWSAKVFLYNLYNFVPYPLTPYFSPLRERIFDWDFGHWREDAPPVFVPYQQTVTESWERFLEKVCLAHRSIRVHCG